MLRSMFSGVSGLRSHQTMMDVIGNNIANVNTFGFKSSTVMFQDLLSQVLTGASAPTGATGGTNPAQVGLGVKVAGVSTSFTQGASQLTGRATDLSIQGDGFFIVRQGGETLFTRAGALDFDALGKLVSPDGRRAPGLGRGPDRGHQHQRRGRRPDDAARAAARPERDRVGPARRQPRRRDTGRRLRRDGHHGLRPARHALLRLRRFTKTDDNEWDFDVDTDGNGTYEAVSTLTFDATTGELTSPSPTFTMLAGTFSGTVAADFGAAGDPDALVQFAGPSTLAALAQDGSALGSLQCSPSARTASSPASSPTVATVRSGRSPWPGSPTRPASRRRAARCSGRPSTRAWRRSASPAAAVEGRCSARTLEMSNVDLAREFTNLIVAQRGFQANSRVITASDELLQDLVNLKR